jgi:hypothetical protein
MKLISKKATSGQTCCHYTELILNAMKRLTFLILCFIVGYALHAQDDEFRTILGNKPLKISGFGGPMMTFTAVGNNFAHMMGGGGGVMINSFFFGGYGLGMTTPITYKGEQSYNLQFGHGGFWAGYTLGSKKPVHVSISSLAGWGDITMADKEEPDNVELQSTENIFVVTPIAELELNFSRFFKLGVGSSMSFVMGPGIDDTSYTASDFAKPSVFLSFKFGWFN